MNCDCCADAGCKFCDGSTVTPDNLWYEVKQFMNVVNKVTAYHRHGQVIPKRSLDELSNRQLDMEGLLKRYEEGN